MGFFQRLIENNLLVVVGVGAAIYLVFFTSLGDVIKCFLHPVKCLANPVIDYAKDVAEDEGDVHSSGYKVKPKTAGGKLLETQDPISVVTNAWNAVFGKKDTGQVTTDVPSTSKVIVSNNDGHISSYSKTTTGWSSISTGR